MKVVDFRPQEHFYGDDCLFRFLPPCQVEPGGRLKTLAQCRELYVKVMTWMGFGFGNTATMGKRRIYARCLTEFESIPLESLSEE